MGNSVTFCKAEVGLSNDFELLVGTNVLISVVDGVKVNTVDSIVGNVVVFSEIKVGIVVSKVVGALDSVKDPEW